MPKKAKADEKPTLKQIRSRLEWVKEQILANPKRYSQSDWGDDRCTTECGTVGCIAGWLDFKLNGMAAHLRHLQQDADDPSEELGFVEREGMRALGLSTDTDSCLWLFEAEWGHDNGYPLNLNGNPGTKEYARCGALAIDIYLNEIGA